LKESTGKRLRKLGDKSRLKKRRSLTEGYQGDTPQNSSTDGEIGSTRGRGDGMKNGPNGNIPWGEES